MANKNPPSQELSLRLHRAMREFPRYNRFLDTAHGLALAPVESHMLVEVGGATSLPVKELIDRLGLEKSAVSKLVKKLIAQSLLGFAGTHADKRQKNVRLLPPGKNLLKKFDRASDEHLQRLGAAASFTGKEFEHLEIVLTAVADALGAPYSQKRSGEHHLRCAIRRLTRAFQLLDRRAMGSRLNTLEWQTLLSVCENPGFLTPAAIGRQFEITKPATALTVAQLLRLKYIVKRAQDHDRRSFRIFPLPPGLSLVKSIEEDASARLSACRNLQERDVAIVERFVRSAGIYHHLEKNELEIRVLRGKDLELARHETLAMYLQDPKRLKIPERCFDATSRSFGLFTVTKQIAAVELAPTASRVLNFYFSPELAPETLRAFVIAASGNVAKPVVLEPGLRTILAPQTAIPTALAQLFL